MSCSSGLLMCCIALASVEQASGFGILHPGPGFTTPGPSSMLQVGGKRVGDTKDTKQMRDLVAQGATLGAVGKIDEALEKYAQAKQLYEEAGTLSSKDGEELMTYMGNAKGQKFDYKGALADYGQAKTILTALGELETSTGADLLQFIGNIKGQQGNWKGATDVYGQAKAILQQLNEYESPRGITLMEFMGNVKGQERDFPGALEAYQEAKRIVEKTQPGDVQEFAQNMFIGNIYGQQHEFSAAMDSYNAAKDVLTAHDQLESPNGPIIMEAIGNTKGQQHDMAGSLAAFEEAQRLYTAIGQPVPANLLAEINQTRKLSMLSKKKLAKAAKFVQ